MISGSKPKVYLFFSSRSFTLKKRAFLKKFIADIFRREGKQLDRINYIFCNDKYLLKLNREYLSHNFYTDILTFNLSDRRNKIAADVYISVDRVRKNSSIFKTSFSKELYRVMFHGVLHLCGYGDTSQKQALQMRKKEDFYLSSFYVKR